MKKYFLLAVSMFLLQMTFAQNCPGPDKFAGECYSDEGEFGAHLSWDRAEYDVTLDRFEIYNSMNGVDFQFVARIVNTPSITHYEYNSKVDKEGLYFYRITAFYQDGCESEPEEVQVNVSLTSASEILAENVAVYPNPTSGKININAEAGQKVAVINALGQVLISQDIDNDNVTIDLSALGNGIYLVKIFTEKGNIVKMINLSK